MIELLLCLSTLCSNDMLGILNDERVCWDPADGAETYEIAADGTLCAYTVAPMVCADLDSSCRGDRISVRACNVVGCSAWSDPVEVLPFACLRAAPVACEYPCWTGAPYRLANIPHC